jgi:superfamily II DNA or RNA helicase
LELRNYQEKTVEMVRDEIRKGNKRILIALPTGAGKTHVLSDIAKKAVTKENTVLALMHRRQLVTQMVDSFAENEIEADIIMSGIESRLESKVQVGTVQTYLRRLQLDAIEYNRFFINAAIVMIDEAHHTLSKSYQQILKHYENKVIIGVTATPVLSSGIGMGTFFQVIVCPVSVQSLVDSGHLVPGRYYGPSTPDLSKVKIVMGDYHKTELNKVMNQPKLIGDVVQNWLKLAENRQTMVFAVKVNHSKALCEEFNRMGIPAEHLDAHDEDEVRTGSLDRFRSCETRILCNVGLYTEGTDIPEIQCIILARPTKSLGFHLQMVGRGARPSPGKKDFMILDHGGNIERLGFYEEEIEWTLDGKGLGYKKKREYKKEKKPFTCEMCSCVHTGKRCPECGWEIKGYGKKIEALEAELVELGKNKKPKASMQEKQLFYGMLEHYRQKKGYKKGWSFYKFKEKFQCNPAPVIQRSFSTEPDEKFLNWIMYMNIRSAKRRQNDAALKPIMNEMIGDVCDSTLTELRKAQEADGRESIKSLESKSEQGNINLALFAEAGTGSGSQIKMDLGDGTATNVSRMPGTDSVW